MNDPINPSVSKHQRNRPLWVASCLAVAILILLAGIAWATSYGAVTATWDDANTRWQLSGTVTYTGGDKTTCVSGTFNSGAGTFGPIFCSTNTSPYTCNIPGASVANSTTAVSYSLSTWTGTGSCTGSSSAGPTGQFALGGTTSNAVALTRLAAVRDAAGWQMAAVAFAGLLGLGAGLWWARGRRQPLAR